MQRFASETILALRRAGLDLQVLVGEVDGAPEWLGDIPHRVILNRWLSRILPRAFVAAVRLLWLQLAFLSVNARGSVLIALAHELVPFPRIRQIAVVHDLTDFKAFAMRAGIGTRLRNALWMAGLRRADAVVSISEATRRDLLYHATLDSRRIRVIYEGVERNVFSPSPSPLAVERPFFLYAGTLDPHKNLNFLTEVYRRVRQEGEEVDLVLAGRHDPKRAAGLVKTIPEQLRNDVRFVGFVSNPELASLMSRCAAFVFPSRNEGFGLAAVEAMACAAPVVSSDAGSLGEVVGAGGVLLSPDDVDGWVAVLSRLLTDESYRADLSRRGLERSRSFSWDTAAQAYRRLIDEVCA